MNDDGQNPSMLEKRGSIDSGLVGAEAQLANKPITANPCVDIISYARVVPALSEFKLKLRTGLVTQCFKDGCLTTLHSDPNVHVCLR